LGGVGLVILSSGFVSLLLLPAAPGALAIGWRMALCGIGFGFFQSPNVKAIMGSAPPHRAGGASGIVATARLTGQSTGAALVAYCLTVAGMRGTFYALVLGACFAGLGSIASFSRLAVGPRPS
jgi:DHA2 family multidrug resistance protein-like MFS transporter